MKRMPPHIATVHLKPHLAKGIHSTACGAGAQTGGKSSDGTNSLASVTCKRCRHGEVYRLMQMQGFA
jgi:hypothetical protein